ncbi:16S rRNA (guanine(966)-N(2))-methyltransferase RsmD [Isoptericola croceus]|uniref:16S rRNA (guanine(966)-N(2))-methyltransferase RsmD n=1 Tax=Isoptericola croceus TaxID=3031406 RepID=UPI0023F8F209|nr:16S rRNA (guanine(966)-N(2))-methyltransferase RsmD [Isoptericola croceus]
MTRIVAGTVGGRTLTVPPSGTRPTSERVREAMFSRLEHDGVIDDGRVLDLFAGSGALGIEAASRGAADVTLVESARKAAEIARRNVATLGLGGTVRVLAEPAERCTARLAADGGATGAGGAFDLVLIDPPYDLSGAALAGILADLAAPGVLAPEAVVVVERARRSGAPQWPEGLVPIVTKTYGDTAVHYAEPVEQASASPEWT